MKQVFTRLVDDLDGSTDGVQTYTFTLQNVTYAIDLNDVNADRFFAAFAVFIAAGRRLPRRPYTTTVSPVWGPDTSSRRHRDAAIRTWWAATEHDLGLPPYRIRGSIPRKVRAAYKAKH